MTFFVLRKWFPLLLGSSLVTGIALAQSPASGGEDTSVKPAAVTNQPVTPIADSPSAKPATSAPEASDQIKPTDQTSDPLKRPLNDKQKKENSKKLKQELSQTYKKWLNNDVRYIISPEESAAFKQLSNDEERDQFI